MFLTLSSLKWSALTSQSSGVRQSNTKVHVCITLRIDVVKGDIVL